MAYCDTQSCWDNMMADLNAAYIMNKSQRGMVDNYELAHYMRLNLEHCTLLHPCVISYTLSCCCTTTRTAECDRNKKNSHEHEVLCAKCHGDRMNNKSQHVHHDCLGFRKETSESMHNVMNIMLSCSTWNFNSGVTISLIPQWVEEHRTRRLTVVLRWCIIKHMRALLQWALEHTYKKLLLATTRRMWISIVNSTFIGAFMMLAICPTVWVYDTHCVWCTNDCALNSCICAQKCSGFAYEQWFHMITSVCYHTLCTRAQLVQVFKAQDGNSKAWPWTSSNNWTGASNVVPSVPSMLTTQAITTSAG